MNNNKKPEWAPEGAGKEFASSVMKGVKGGHDGMSTTKRVVPTKALARRKQFTVDEYVEGIEKGDRRILSQAITLIESNARKHLETSQEVLRRILPKTGNAIRIGITGVPGAGKSTFIDTFGAYLCQQGHKVAVLAIDPTSSITRGSILGDKTRMEKLTLEDNCFIRPSPAGGALGGVSRKTRETMLVCEAAGFDVILVETVGVGQSEALVSTMVDFFLLIALTGAGDELQNIKKGVMEMANSILINKADGDNKMPADRLRRDLNNALHYLASQVEGWQTEAHTCSAYTGDGIAEIWQVIKEFEKHTRNNGAFQKKREAQNLDWLHDMVIDQLKREFFDHPLIRSQLPKIEEEVSKGEMPVTAAADSLLQKFYHSQTN